MPTLHRIDVHHHPTLPPELGKTVAERAPGHDWTVRKSLDMMDEGGVARSILSVPNVHETWRDPGIARGRARGWNEFMAKLCADHPGRFGLFAALPIFDIDASLAEIEYALDTLGADGVLMMTNIGDRWLGDPHYAPLLEELDRRGAVVYTHPLAPDCCRGILPDLNDATIEFGTDTSRAIARLLFSGSAARFLRVRFIFSHAGGTMPFIAERFERAHLYGSPAIREAVPNGVMHELRKLYYDTAQAAHRFAMLSLRELVPASQIVFGTDYPYRSAAETARGLCECGFSAEELHAIDCGNAQRLLPGRRADPAPARK